MWRAEALMARGRAVEGAEEIQRALELDPFSPAILWAAGRFASWGGDHERAIELGKRAVDLSPESFRFRVSLWEIYALAGREEEAAQALLGAAAPAARAELENAYAAGGPKALIERFLRFEHERTGQPCGRGRAALYARLGDAEGVFRCLQHAARTGYEAPQVQLDPVFAPYRSDPRYAALLEEMNLRE